MALRGARDGPSCGRPQTAYGPVKQPGSSGARGTCRVRLAGAAGSARGFGRRVGEATVVAIAASTFGQVPSAHQRLYQRQHVDVAA